MDEVSKRLWKSQEGAYGKAKYQDYSKMTIREKVALKLGQNNQEDLRSKLGLGIAGLYNENHDLGAKDVN
jgi:hypothetical protein